MNRRHLGSALLSALLLVAAVEASDPTMPSIPQVRLNVRGGVTGHQPNVDASFREQVEGDLAQLRAVRLAFLAHRDVGDSEVYEMISMAESLFSQIGEAPADEQMAHQIMAEVGAVAQAAMNADAGELADSLINNLYQGLSGMGFWTATVEDSPFQETGGNPALVGYQLAPVLMSGLLQTRAAFLAGEEITAGPPGTVGGSGGGSDPSSPVVP